jgi:hypothetical protein
VSTAFTIRLLTGGITGVGYGVTATDVFGHATLHIRLVDTQQKRVVLERDYQATAKDHRSKLLVIRQLPIVKWRPAPSRK